MTTIQKLRLALALAKIFFKAIAYGYRAGTKMLAVHSKLEKERSAPDYNPFWDEDEEGPALEVGGVDIVRGPLCQCRDAKDCEAMGNDPKRAEEIWCRLDYGWNGYYREPEE